MKWSHLTLGAIQGNLLDRLMTPNRKRRIVHQAWRMVKWINNIFFFFFFLTHLFLGKEKNKCQGVNVGQEVVRFYLICREILWSLDKQFSRKFSPVQVWHDGFADVTAGLLKDPDDFSRSGRVPPGMDDDGAAELSLGMSRGPQHLRLALCDWPADADFSDHTAADVSAVGAVEHLADDDVGELRGTKRGVRDLLVH